tara:strand:+ start:5282 stop:7639 length:2358 start_codon:yes stop_codon:yes gene_type:complete
MDHFNQEKIGVKKGFSLKKEIVKYVAYWKFFAISAMLFVGIAFVYLKVTTPIYNNKTTILIKEAEEGRGVSELAALKGFNLFEGGNDKDDEVEIIGSKYLVAKAVDSLGLNIIQTAYIDYRTVDIYDISPISVDFVWTELGYREEIKSLEDVNITLISDSLFKLEHKDRIGQFAFNEPIIFDQGVLTVAKSKFFEENKNITESQLKPIEQISVKVIPKDYYITELQENILVILKNKRSSVIDVSLKHSNRNKANALLDNLIYQYNKDAMKDVNLIAKNTATFINHRLSILTEELDSIEKSKVMFKKANKLTDIKVESEVFIQENSESKKKLFDIVTQLSITQSIKDYLQESDQKHKLVPENIGLSNSSINNSIVEYNKLVLERNRLLSEDATENNPFVVALGIDISSYKENLLNALNKQIDNLKITQFNFEKEKSEIDSKILTIPQKEQDYLSILRQQTIKENLYVFLLSRKEENSISMSVTSPIAKVIEQSSSSNKPIYPKSIVVLLLSLVLGLGVPFVFVYIKELLNTKVMSIDDVKSVLKDVSILGETIRISKSDSQTIGVNDRSVLAESFRIIRMNLNFFVRNKKKENKAVKIFVTSSVKGEGKTLVSFNTMLSLVDTGAKTLLVGGDIRNPQLHRYLNTRKKQKGLTDYLSLPNVNPSELINSITEGNRSFDFIEAGIIPPNPSELLLNGKLDELLRIVENNYDYIIVDTAPIALVADTLLVANSADLMLYVVRSEYTEKEHLKYINNLFKEGKAKNIALILNGVKLNKSGYGYGYGYGQ